MSRIWRILTRKKAIDPVTAEETRLNRVLNTFDLTALGVGSTLGVGIYVLGGQVAKEISGPSVVLSFLIAGIASAFAGLCYAEFGARAPRAGSAYIYSYVCVGEFIAFVIGWNLILEYVIGSASVAKGLSLYLDSLINNTMQDTFRHIAPINAAFMSQYFDFFSFSMSVLLAVALAFGMKESSMGNNIVTVLNILVVLFVIVAGSIKANISNWYISPNNTDNSTINVGDGGFFPFGIEGMIKGAATCFYGFVGFDCIATTGEEVKNPRRAIPISIIVSLLIIFCAYFGVSTVLTLMIPFYQLDHDAPIPRAFQDMGWDWAKWIVAIGAIFGLCASLFGAMFPLPRIIYAMGSDGLVFKFLAKVHPKFQTPIVGTIFAGVLTGLMSALFNLSQLINMMSIGTLLAYTIVAASVLMLRYKEDVKKVYIPVKLSSDTDSTSSESSDGEKYNDDTIRQNFDGPTTSDEMELISNESTTCCKSLLYIFNCRNKEPNRITENIVAVEVFLYCILCVCIGLCAIYLQSPIINKEIWAISLTAVVVSITVLLIMSLATQPTSKKELSFKVPLVPLIPALSIMVNIYLMLMLDYRTWIRFAVWMALGLPMYYVCVCSHKAHHKHVNGMNYSANITCEHIKMMNGHSNPTFEPEESNPEESKGGVIHTPVKKKTLAPSPPAVELTENIDVQQDAVIAQLDQVLEKAVLSDWGEDSLSDQMSRVSDRKLSAGSVSNLSVVMSNCENVVADVHCADPSTDPNLSSPSNYDHNVTEITDHEISKDLNTGYIAGSEENYDVITDKKEQDTTINKAENVENNFDEGLSISMNVSKSSDKVVDKTNENDSSKHFKINQEQLFKEVKEMTSIQNSSLMAELGHKVEEINSSDGKVQASQLPSLKTFETPSVPPFPDVNSSNMQAVANVGVSAVPTAHALRSVTLRKVQKAIKEVTPSLNENASEGNLRAGTEEFKNFLRNLDGKLKARSTVPPNYPLFRNYVPANKPQEMKPNENVVEEKIDRVDAKNKLEKFLENGNQRKSEDLNQINNNTENLLQQEKLQVIHETKNSPTIAEIALKEHQNKMKNVFNSMKLTKDKTGDFLTRRLSKSLGSSFAKDDHHRTHKVKMQDIFKSIQALNTEK